MSRDTVGRQQVWFYLAAVVLGLLVGTLWPDAGHTTEALGWPVLALLLYATFTQMPLVTIPVAFKDGQFLATALIGNFAVIPLLAVVILLVATAHVGEVGKTLHPLPVAVGIAVAFLAVMLVRAKLLGLAARLPAAQGRALAFSLGTRNSFIVLPVALSLPAG